MRSSFPKAFPLIIGFEGKLSTNPKDPGNYYPDGRPGFTIWGFCTRWHPTISKDMTIEEAMDKYLFEYWIPAGCDDLPFPMDVALFDSQVNPQNDPKLPYSGNKEILAMNPENWQDYNLMRASRYMRVSKPDFVKGHVFRVLNLSDKIRKLR